MPLRHSFCLPEPEMNALMDYNLYHEAEKVVGGRFKLAAMLQKRIVQLMRGDPKLVDLQTDNLKEIALREILEGKIELVLDEGGQMDVVRAEGQNGDKHSLFDY